MVGLLLGLKVTSQNKVLQEKERQIADLQNTININQQEFQKLKTEISKTEEQTKKQMEYVAQPDLPIRFTFRNAFMGNTKVLQLTNYSNNHIRVNVSSDFEGRKQSRTIDLTPRILNEIGQKQGFPFKSGDSVTIEAKGYRSLTKSVP